jgi:hypothetical protein
MRLCFNSVISNTKLVTVVLKDYKLKIKVIALASVFLIGYIHLCKVNNIFSVVYNISNSYKGIVIIVIIITGKVK